MSITGPENGEPIRVGVAIVDLLAGHNATTAILAALFARERQKTGQRIDISLLDSQVATLTYVASNYLVSGKSPKRYGNAHPNIVPYQSFKAKDGYLAFAAGNDLQWKRFCQEVNREDLLSDARFSTNPARVTNRVELIALLDDLFATKTVEEWLAVCAKATVPAARINSVDKALSDPRVLARDLIVEGTLPDGEAVRMLASPLKYQDQPFEVRHSPPLLGQHTDQILREILGYGDSTIEELRQAKAI
jgi:formyl-CoA transferase